MRRRNDVQNLPCLKMSSSCRGKLKMFLLLRNIYPIHDLVVVVSLSKSKLGHAIEHNPHRLLLDNTSVWKVSCQFVIVHFSLPGIHALFDKRLFAQLNKLGGAHLNFIYSLLYECLDLDNFRPEHQVQVFPVLFFIDQILNEQFINFNVAIDKKI